MIAKWLFQTVVWIVALAALLFVPAGTLHWPAAWVFLVFMALIGFGFGTWLARTNPGLLAERMRAPIQADQPPADKLVIFGFGALALIFFIAMGLDERFHGSQMAIGWQVLGLVLLILACAFIAWVFNENT